MLFPRHALRLAIAALLLLSPSFAPNIAFVASVALAQEATTQDRKAEADRLYQEGDRLLNEGQYQAALEQFQQALEIYRELGDRYTEAETLTTIGNAYLNTPGQRQQALEAYQRSLALFRELGNLEDEARGLRNVGVAYGFLDNLSTAIDYIQQSLAIYERLNDKERQAGSYTLLGSLYWRLAEYSVSLNYHQRALKIHRELHLRKEEAESLLFIGDVYASQGQYSQALNYYQHSLTIHQELNESEWVGTILSYIGNTYRALGQYSQALNYYQQSLPELIALDGLIGEAYYYENMGWTYLLLGQHQQALDSFQESLRISKELGSRAGEASALHGLGNVYSAIGNYQEALEIHQQQLLIEQDINQLGGQAAALLGLGIAYTGLQKYQVALETYQQSLIIYRNIGSFEGEREVLAEIGKLFSLMGETSLSILFYKEAVNTTEEIRQNLRPLPRELQESYTETIADIYRQLADLLLQQDRVLEAQQVLDLLKVQELDDYLQNVRGSDRPTQSLEYLQPEQRILDLYNQAITQGQELMQLRQIPDGDRTLAQQQRLAQLVANQQNLAQSFDDFLNRPDVNDAIDQLSRTARRQNIDLEQLNALQDNLRRLNQNAVLLYPLILDDRLELVLVTPYSPPIRRTVNVGRTELNQAIAQFRTLISSPRSNARPKAQQLYEWLIAPIEDDLRQANAETILYAPDGALRYIPLAALYDGSQWLIQRYRINNITAASLTDFDTPRQPSLSVLAGAFTEGSYSFAIGTRQFSFSGLPFAGIEVQNIAAEIPGTTELVDRAFSPQAMIPRMDDYTIVHLATHAEFVSGSPDDSFILFGNGDRVTLRDIALWSLPNVDLVVLSACKTAVGGELGNGEEILGFGYQMQRTGARAAIASLWSIDDGGTQVLMDAFYQALEQPGITKAEVLRQAQIALITGDYDQLGIEVSPQLAQYLDRPYYWAPFILIGNGL